MANLLAQTIVGVIRYFVVFVATFAVAKQVASGAAKCNVLVAAAWGLGGR